MDADRLQAHIRSLEERIAQVQSQIQENTNAAVARQQVGNRTGAMSRLRMRRLKRDRLALLQGQLAEARELLAIRQPQAAALPNNAQTIFNNIDRIAAASARSLLPAMSEAELDEEMRRAEHAQYLANMARGAANAASASAGVGAGAGAAANAAPAPAVAPNATPVVAGPPPPGSAASYANVVRTDAPSSSSGPVQSVPGGPTYSRYPIRIGGKSRRHRARGRRSKSRRRPHKTTLKRRS